jgi:hypothetical protein
MYISLTSSLATGFRNWSDAHPPRNDDDEDSGGAAPFGVTEPPADDREPIGEPPHQS